MNFLNDLLLDNDEFDDAVSDLDGETLFVDTQPTLNIDNDTLSTSDIFSSDNILMKPSIPSMMEMPEVPDPPEGYINMLA